MPILSVYFGDKVISSVCVADDGSSTKRYFEYTYSPYLYSHFYSEERFNTDIINYLLKEYGLEKTNIKIIVVGLLDVPKLNTPVACSVRMLDLIQSVENIFPIMVNYQSILTKNEFVYSQRRQNQDVTMTDSASNMGIYNFSDPTFQSSHFISQSRTLDLTQVLHSDPILLFGEVFRNTLNQEKSLVYKFLLDLIVPVGVYKLFFEDKLIFAHKLLLDVFNEGKIDGEIFAGSVLELCTLINVPGETTCLIESELGTSQLVSIKAEDIFILPLTSRSELKILIKNQIIGTRRITVTGGELGLIIDTRNKSGELFNADSLNNALTRKLDEASAAL